MTPYVTPYGAAVTGTALLLSLLTTAVFLYALFHVVRAAVEGGVRRALRDDLLRDWASRDRR